MSPCIVILLVSSEFDNIEMAFSKKNFPYLTQ